MIVYFTGIDGSGKSTIAVEIAKKFNANSTCDIIWARYSPRWIKMLIAPFKSKHVSNGSDYNTMSGKEYSDWTGFKKKITRNRLLSKALFFLQFIEYSFQTRKIFNLKTEHLVIDRYILDFIVDQSINYGNIEQSWLVKILLNRIKKINYVFFIDVEESIAFSRKSDIPSLEYLKVRRALYLQYIKKIPNGFVVKNESDINLAIEEIWKQIK